MKLEEQKKETARKVYKGMTAYEVGATQGHSRRKVDSMIKMAKTKGRESLNSPKRGRDNDVALGKNEQEKS